MDPTETLSEAAQFGWATFVLVLVILVLSAFAGLWMTKVAIPRLKEERRHNEADEKILRDLSDLLRDLKRSMDTNERLARRIERYFVGMCAAKKLELRMLSKIAKKLSVDIEDLAARATDQVVRSETKTGYEFEAIPDSGEIPNY